MNQQRAIRTLTGQRQAVLIARSLMSWYAFLSEEVVVKLILVVFLLCPLGAVAAGKLGNLDVKLILPTRFPQDSHFLPRLIRYS